MYSVVMYLLCHCNYCQPLVRPEDFSKVILLVTLVPESYLRSAEKLFQKLLKAIDLGYLIYFSESISFLGQKSSNSETKYNLIHIGKDFINSWARNSISICSIPLKIDHHVHNTSCEHFRQVIITFIKEKNPKCDEGEAKLNCAEIVQRLNILIHMFKDISQHNNIV